MRSYRLKFVSVLLATLASHLLLLVQTPWDWDEPVYTEIAQSVQERGFPSLQTGTEMAEWYAYHPPFHFYLLSSWYDLTGQNGIASGRLLSTLVAVTTVGLAMLVVREVNRDDQASILTGATLSIDGWFSYTSLLVKIDTTAIMIGLVGYLIFLQQGQAGWKRCVLAGTVVGFAGAYKHVALVFAAAMALDMIGNPKWRRHLLALIAVAIVLTSYWAAMSVFVGEPFNRATTVQINRVLGVQVSRGLNYGLAEALQALGTTYWAFGGTLLLLAFCLVVLAAKLVRVKALWHTDEKLLLLLALSSLLMLAGIKLRNPHYLGFLIVPAYMVGVPKLEQWSERLGWRKRFSYGVITAVLVMNIATFGIRLLQFSNGNALEEVRALMATLPGDANVLADEPVCAMITQTCFRIGVTLSSEELTAADIDYIVLYSSITQRPPTSPALDELIALGTEVRRIQDWKATIPVLYVGDVENGS